MPRSPRLRSIATALLLLGVTGIALGLLAVRGISAPLAAAPALQQGEGPSPCVISGTKRASPMQALFGEPISITMAVEAACPAASDIATAALIDPLGARVGLVANSAAPPPTTLGADGRRPEWRFAAVPASGITVTLVVTPTSPGFVTTNAGATWTITDTDGLTSSLRLPNPQVLVLGGPGPAATATSVTTPTATTAAATGTATIPPSATATPVVVTATTAPPEPSDTPTPPDGGGGTGGPPETGTPTPELPLGTGTPTSSAPGPTATEAAPDPSATPVAPGPTATSDASAVPPPGTPAPIYLPYLDRGALLGFDPDAVPDPRLDTVLLLEIHRDMQDQKVGLKRAFMQFARNIFFAPDQAPRRMGLVSFGGNGHVTCAMQEDIDGFEACLDQALAAAPVGNGDLAEALTRAGTVLDEGGAGLGRTPARSVVALAFKERPEGCTNALAAKDALVARGTRLITICPGDGCERTCLRDVASARVDYIVIQSLAQLLPFLDTVGERLLGIGTP